MTETARLLFLISRSAASAQALTGVRRGCLQQTTSCQDAGKVQDVGEVHNKASQAPCSVLRHSALLVPPARDPDIRRVHHNQLETLRGFALLSLKLMGLAACRLIATRHAPTAQGSPCRQGLASGPTRHPCSASVTTTGAVRGICERSTARNGRACLRLTPTPARMQ